MSGQCTAGHANATSVAIVPAQRAALLPPSMTTNDSGPPVRRVGEIRSTSTTAPRTDEVVEDAVALAGVQSNPSDEGLQLLQDCGGWLVDSGTSVSMTADQAMLNDYKEARGTVMVASSDRLDIVGRGTVRILCPTASGATAWLEFPALHVPGLAYNLLSTDDLVDRGHHVSLTERPMIELDNGVKILCERWRPRTLLLPVQSAYITATQLHERLGHANIRTCLEVARDNDVQVTGKMIKCEPCALGKVRRRDIPKTASRVFEHPLDLVSADAAGPFPRSLHNQRYVLAYTDKMSGATWVYFTRAKSGFADTLQKFVAEAGVPKLLRTDGAPDLVAGSYKSTALRLGIRSEQTASDSPQQNGQVERSLATLTADARTLLADTGLPRTWWALAIGAACVTRNVIKLNELDGEKKAEATAVCRVPALNMLRRWGVRAVVLDPKAKKTAKLQPRGKVMIFAGYKPGLKGWVFLNPSTGRLVCSRDAVFFEDVSGATLLNGLARGDVLEDDSEPTDGFLLSAPGTRIPTPTVDADADDELSDDGDAGTELGWMDFDDELLQDQVRFATRQQSGTVADPIDLCAAFGDVPTKFNEAMASDNARAWQSAIDEELANHERHGTWSLVPASEATGRVLSNGWTFGVKLSQDGSVLRNKARLFVRGCGQTPDQYGDTTAPVSNLIMFRLMLHRAVSTGASVRHIDIKAAYLNAPLQEDVYMKIPQGVVVDSDVPMVCKLQRSLYGLKQAGANWNAHLHEALLAFGFTQSQVDQCTYQLKGSDDAELATVTVYVDDLFLLAANEEVAERVVEQMRARYDVKVTPLKVYLSQQVELGDNRAAVSQHKYIDEILKQEGMHHANRTRSPCRVKNGVVSERGVEHIDVSTYRKIVGQLQWLQLTVRPDITYAVHCLSRKVASPSVDDCAAAKRVCRYLNGTRGVGICMHAGGALVAYADSDWAGCVETRKSVSGYIIGYLRDDGLFSPIAWRSRKQTCVAQSTCEAEYVALHDVCREISYLRALLSDLGWLGARAPTKVFCDNRSAVIIGNDDGRRTKYARYIDIRYHYARWCANEGRVVFVNIGTNENIADAFTKGLPYKRHEMLAQLFTTLVK